MDDKKIAKMIRQNVAKVEKKAKANKGRVYDPTLQATQRPADDESGIEREQFFKEMKRREF